MNYFLDTEFHEYQKQPLKIFGVPLGKPTDTIELISIGIVDQDGREYYAICKNFDVEAAFKNEWLKENVLKQVFYELFRSMPVYEKTHHSDHIKFNPNGMRILLAKFGKSKEEIAEEIVGFIYGENKKVDGMTLVQTAQTYEINHPILKPEFYGYYCDYNWVTFCWLFGRMIDLPKGFPMYCRDLKQMLDGQYMHQVNKYEGLSRLEAWLQDVKKLPNYPKQTNEHNALADARWNKELFQFIERFK